MDTGDITALRCENWTDEGIACGPISLTSIVVEAEITSSPDTKCYLIGTWNDNDPNRLSFEVFPLTVIDKFVRASGEDVDAICNARNQENYQYIDEPNDSVYVDIIIQVAALIKEKIVECGYLDEEDTEELFESVL